MSNKNIVTGQLAKVTTYDPTTSQVTGVSTTGNVTTTTNVNATSVLLGSGNLQLTGNVISTASDTITIDPLNDASPLGNVNVLGNLSVIGTLSYVNIANSTTNDFTWIAANNAVNQAAASGGGLAVGPAGGYASFTYNSLSNSWQSSLPLVATGGANINGNLSGATNGSFNGNVLAQAFIGDGGNLSNITGANVLGAVSFATTANSVAGGNVLGAVSFATTANAVAGANVSGAVSFATTANSVAGGNVVGAVAYASTANTVAGANVVGQVANALVAGTVIANAQPNITTVGSLISLTVSGQTASYGNVSAPYYYGNGSTLTGILAPVTGTIACPNGNATINLTLPLSGTYVLALTCNIPNGIMTYQATLTVTNNNVPILGSQWAWYYASAGTPIKWTSLPNQIVGTLNSISYSSPSVSIPSNVLYFGVQNDTGGFITINYSYTKVG